MTPADPHSTASTFSPNTDTSVEVNEHVQVIPVIEEQVSVDKQTVETGRVHIKKVVHQESSPIRLNLTSEVIDIEHVPLNRVVDAAPVVRYEGDTTIIPVVREEVVKRLILVEEIRITKRQQQSLYEENVQLRREEVIIDRADTATQPPLSPQA